jgi:tRNA dimethylallyltransferase
MEVKLVDQLPLIVIAGPTASGKTGLAIKLAKRFNGEIICADSRTVYAGMDIGTAKPTIEERRGVPHWGLDLVEPGEPFSVAQFKEYAVGKIAEIRARGRVPFLVGGTGLYIDAVIFNYIFEHVANPELREELSVLSIEELHDYCYKNNITLPENKRNKRYVIRAIEQNGINKQRQAEPISMSIIVGISTDRDILRSRIVDRTEQFFTNGVVEESIKLGKKYGWDNEAMTGNVYPLLYRYSKDELSLDEVKDKFTTLDWRLAKRQLTWLRRNKYVKWLSLTEAEKYLFTLLETEHKV